MKSYGIEFEKGTSIENANIEYAAKFPEAKSETSGQLFFRTDENKLYIRNANNTAWLSLTPAAVTEQTTKPGDPPHGFTDRDIGTPIYFGTDSRWHKAIADSMKTVPTAVVSHVVDKTHFITQQSGTINGISPNVNADGGPLIPGEYYYVSNTVAGKYTKQVPAKDQIKSLSILAVAPDVALLLNYAPQKALFLKDIADFDVPPTAKPTNGQIIKYNEHSASGNGGWEFADEVQVSIGTIHLPGGTAASPTGISDAWKALGTTQPTDPMVIANYAGSAYIKLGDGNDDHHWTLLGSATAWATPQEVIDGTETAKGVTPATLKGALGTYLPLTGGRLTGTLELSADPVNPMEAVTKQYVNDVEKDLSDELNTYVNDLNQDIGKIFDQGINALIDTPPTDGQTLVYDTTTDPANPKWKPGAVSTGGTGGSVTLSGLTDVDLTRTPTAGQTLVYDTTDPANPTWKPGKAGVDTLEALTDTTITSATDGQILIRKGGSWENDNFSLDIIPLKDDAANDIGQAYTNFGRAKAGGTSIYFADYNSGIYICNPSGNPADSTSWRHLGDYLRLKGGTLTGNLILPDVIETPGATATPDNAAVNKKYVDKIISAASKNVRDMTASFNAAFTDPTTGSVLKTDSINALADVDTTTNPPTNKQTLIFDGTNWIPDDSTLAELTDVDTTTTVPSDGLVLAFKGPNVATGKWEPKAISVQVHSEPLTGADIASAWLGKYPKTGTPKEPEGVVIGVYNSEVYVKTGDGGTPGGWTKLGSGIDFATATDMNSGTDITKALNVKIAEDWIKANYLPLAGGTVTGAITLNADPANALEAATKQYVDAHSPGIVDLTTAPTAGQTLIYDDGSSTWKPGVGVSWANQGEIYNGTETAKGITPATLKVALDVMNLGRLIDVDLTTTPTDGQTLVYDPTGGASSTPIWKPGKAGVDTLAALTDTNIGTLTSANNGVSLVYNGTAGKWEAQNITPTVGNAVMSRSGTGTGKNGIGTAWTSLPGSKPTDPIIIANYDGSAYVKTGPGGNDKDWVSLGSSTAYLPLTGGALTGGLTLNADPTNDTDAANKKYVDDQDKLNLLLAGGTMTGSLILNAAPTVDLGAATKKYVDDNKVDTLAALTDTDLTTAPTAGQTLVYDGGSSTWKPGAGVSWATQAEVNTGTEAAKGVTPATLKGQTVVAGPTAVTNSGKLVGLSTNGKIDSALLPVIGTAFQGAFDFTGGVPTSPSDGNIWFNKTTGTTVAAMKTPDSATGAEPIKAGDMVVYEAASSQYHIIAKEEELADFVSKSGNNSIGAGMTMTWTATTGSTTVLDGADKTKTKIENFTVDNCILDGGIF